MFAVRCLLGAAIVFAAIGAAVITIANPLWPLCLAVAAAVGCIAAALLVERKL